MIRIEPLRGFGLGFEIAAALLWIAVLIRSPEVVNLFGTVEYRNRARAFVQAMGGLILVVIGSYIGGTSVNLLSQAPIIPSTWIPIFTSFACVSVAMSLLLVIRYVPRRLPAPKGQRQ